jgi:hypothetical protein
MSNELVKKEKTDIAKEHEFSLIEQVVMQGDLSKLTSEQRVMYYNRVCESAGLNPYTRPFDYISLNGKLTLYAKKDCTEQLRKLNGVSIISLEDKLVDDIYIVTAKASDNTGRIDQSKGAVTIGHLKGEHKANAIMKAETKAKRRVTLSICGMGFTDESEIDSIPNAKPVLVDAATGEIQIDYVTPEQAKELSELAQACDPSAKENRDEYIRKKCNGGDLSKLPAACYDTVKKRFLDSRQSYLDKLSKQIEDKMNGEVEE